MKIKLLAFLLFAAPAMAQNARYDNVAFTSSSLNAAFIANATITVCTSAGSGLPCTPKVSGLCLSASDASCTQPNPTSSDSLGNYGFWIQPGTYIITVTKAGLNGYSTTLTLSCQLASSCTIAGATTFTGAVSINTPGSLSDSGTATFTGAVTATAGGNSINSGLLNGLCVVDGVKNATLAAAVTCAGTNGVVDVPMFAVPTLTAGVTIPAGVTLKFEGGSPGLIQLGNFNLTINGPLVAPAQAQIFSYTGSGTVSFTNYPIPIWTEWFSGADMHAQFNNAEAACGIAGVGCTIATGPCITAINSCDAGGNWQVSTQASFTKTVTWIGGWGHPATNNAGEHFMVGVTWTSGAGPTVLMSGAACSGSRIDGFRYNNTSATLVGFQSIENACSKTFTSNISIDPVATPAISYGIQVGNPATGAVNDTHIEDIRIVGAAPICLYAPSTSANLVQIDVWTSSCGYSGTVNTSNGALGGCTTNCVQVTSGANFPIDGSWTNVPIVTCTAVPVCTEFIVSTVNNSTSLTLTTAPGTQTGVTFARAAQRQYGSSTTSSNIMTEIHGYAGPSVGGAVSCTPCLALPDIQYVNIFGDHVHVGTTFEIGSYGGIQGFSQETNPSATINGTITCNSCTMNATQGAAGGVTSYMHFNNVKTSFGSFGSSFGANTGILAATAFLYQNDNSAAVVSQENAANVSVTVNLANGSLGTAHINSSGDTNGGNSIGLVSPASTLFGDSVAFGQTNANLVGSTGDINVARKSGNLGQILFGTGASQRFGFSTLTAGAFVETPGQTIFQEASCVAGSSTNDLLCADSTAHRLMENANNGGSAPVVSASGCVTSQKSESAADANVLTCTPVSSAASYRVRFVMSVSAANAATLGWTITWTDSNGNAQTPTNLALSQSGVAAPALTFTTSAAGDYYGYIDIDVNSATNIVVKLTFSGTSFAAKVSASVERVI